MQIYRNNPPSRLIKPHAPVPPRDIDLPRPIRNEAVATSVLLREIRSHMAETGLSASKFGTLAMNDPGFVSRVIAGAVLRDETIRRARKFIGENTHV